MMALAATAGALTHRKALQAGVAFPSGSSSRGLLPGLIAAVKARGQLGKLPTQHWAAGGPFLTQTFPQLAQNTQVCRRVLSALQAVSG